MANALYGGTWVVDTVGIISKTPVRIRAIEVDPSAAGGLVLFNWWDEANAVSGANRSLGNCTITSTTTITDAATGGVLTAARYPATNVLKIFKTIEGGGNGSTANHTYHLIETAGDNNVIVTAASLTNEANKSYKFDCYPSRTAISITTPGTEVVNEYRFYGSDGIWFPNLVLETITNVTKAVLYLA